MLEPRRIQDEPLNEAERDRLYTSQAASLRTEGFETSPEELRSLHERLRHPPGNASDRSMHARSASGRTFTAAEQQAMKEGVLLASDHLEGHLPSELDLGLLASTHRFLSGGVDAMHGGRLRSGDIVFGSHMGTAPGRLHEELAAMLEAFHQERAYLELLDDGEDLVDLALWVHAEIVRIHPFADGNGRLSRLIMDWLMLSYAFPTVILPEQKVYYRILGRYLVYGDRGALRELL